MAKIHIAAYLSGHGFGHVSRSLEAISRILFERQDWVATIISTRAENFAKTLEPGSNNWAQVKGRIRFRHEESDVGIIQKDSLGMDLSETEKKLFQFSKTKDSFIEKESKFCAQENVNLIWSDSASLPFRVSHRNGIPSLFLGSFTWDFIYSKYESSNFADFAQDHSKEYSLCDLGLILPFSCPVTSIRNTKEIGLLGRRPTLSKEEARKQFGFEADITYFLFSFGAYGVEAKNFDWKNWNPASKRLVTSGTEMNGPSPQSLGVISIPSCHYPNLIRACDYVLTKPGYGILSEAYYAGTPVIYTDRGNFAEYEALVSELKAKFKSAYIPHESLYSFRWDEYAEKARQNLTTLDPRLERDGVQEILEKIDSLL
ncbi:glycosyl transferase [Leptospira perolatii]|uniref:Glycosyl transferase n=1 Tax=Leptospira perolatii TaxID=2023191 RepID=A0A2M9ZK82_9LEPT|nr:glycosyl transferase [Leptospira perolatii]PJZ69234.1 glycosyl transferase [Leptospira perolatii]PJZ72384.1 glycosyl transferase [Leptospira perolatii]